MEGRRIRIGDVIDDYCTRCRLIMNHGVVGMVGEEVVKVRCNTCQSEHPYKHARLPKKRRGEADRLFAEVLRGIAGPGGETPPEEAAAGETLIPDEENVPEEETARDEPNGDAPAAPAPPEDMHGVRRKLFTIRRHSGGKPPGTGTPGAKR
jgi:hypothetical protein